MDRVDKALLILPLLPIADLLSTLFSLRFGGEEIGILARPILENYGAHGLILLAASASAIFLVFMQVVIQIRRFFIKESTVLSMRHLLTIPIYWFFILEGVYVSTVTLNLLVPLAFPMTSTIILRVLLTGAYFACVSALTMPQMKQLQHFS